MYQGTVKFAAEMGDPRIAFSNFIYEPALPGVQAVRLETVQSEILASVDVSSVATPSDGAKVAQLAVERALNRLAFFQHIDSTCEDY